MVQLTEIQSDTLTEVINIGVGKAAALFNDLIDSHVDLEIPKIHFYRLAELQEILKGYSKDLLTAVTQPFYGEFGGTSAMIFSSENANKIVELVADDDDEDDADPEIYKTGFLSEIGNIINNALLGSISNVFDCHLKYSLPEYSENSFSEIILKGKNLHNEIEGVILFGEVNFCIKSFEIKGFFLLYFEIEAESDLINLVDKSLDELMADDYA